MSPHDDEIALTILECLHEDRERGALRPLADYLGRWPGSEELVAREYLAFRERDGSQADRPRDDAAPLIGPFRLDTMIGRGGQGIVWRAADTRLERIVAVKVLSDPRFGVHANLERFRREALLAARLEHPAICRIYESALADGVPYIAMQFVEGITLADALAGKTSPGASSLTLPSSDGPLPSSPADIERILAFFEQLARALHFAHEQGIVHRDIKPGNIMIRPDGEPMILDFGLARSLEDDQLATLTRTGEGFGTPAYLPPEQVSGSVRTLDRRADVHALGVTLYECLTGVRPFQGATQAALLRSIECDEPKRPSRIHPVLNRSVDAVLATALAKSLDRRYRTAALFADDLEALRLKRPVSARSTGPVERAVNWSRRHKARAALLLILLATVPTIAGLGGYVVATRPQLEEQERSARVLEADERLELGFRELFHGDPEASIARFEEAAALIPGLPEAQAGIVLALLRTDRAEHALERLEADDHPALIPLRAEVLETLGRPDEARTWLERCRAPTTALDWFLLGLRSLEQANGTAPGQATIREAAFLRARDEFQLAIQASSRGRRVHIFHLAHAVGSSTQRPDADLIALTLQTRWPDDPMAWFWAAVALGEEDDGSLDALRAAERIAPTDATIQRRLGHTLLRWGSLEEAAESFREAVRLAGDDPGPRVDLASTLRRMGRVDEARATLDQVLALSPRHVGALVALADVAMASGAIAEGCDQLMRAAEIAPESVTIQEKLMRSALRIGRHELAITAAEALTRIEPHVAEWHFHHGAYLARYRGEKELAERSLSRAVTLNPGHVHAQWALGDVRIGLGDRAGGIESYRSAVARSPGDFWRHEQLGATLIDHGLPEEGLRELSIARQLAPKSETVLTLMATTQEHCGRLNEAAATLETLLTIREDAALHERLAVLFANLERRGDAVTHYEAAHRLAPRDDRLALQLAIHILSLPSDHPQRDLERAHALAERVRASSSPPPALALDVLARTAFARGEVGRALALQEEVIRMLLGRSEAGITLDEARRRHSRYADL